jgi:hypothetical protein
MLPQKATKPLIFQPAGRWLLGLSLLLPLATAAQPAPGTADGHLAHLLQERKLLTRQYAEASAQRHSLFGNKPSKKDLQEVVDALQGIVDKDQEIVDVLNQTARSAQTAARHYSTTATQLENTGRDDRNLTSQRFAELENELQNRQQRERQQTQKLRDAEAEIAESREGRLWRDGLIAGLGVVCAALLLWRRKRR